MPTGRYRACRFASCLTAIGLAVPTAAVLGEAGAVAAAPTVASAVASPGAPAVAKRRQALKRKQAKRAKAKAQKRRNAANIVAPALVRASDLGSGWGELSSGTDANALRKKLEQILAGVTVSPAACAAGWTVPQGFEAIEYKVFRRGSSDFGPYFGQAVARFATANDARAALAHAQGRVSECGDLTVQTKYGVATVTIRSVATDPGSQHSANYLVNASLSGISGQGRVSAMQRGRWVSGIGYATLGSMTASEVSTFKNAAKKVEGR